MIYPRVCEVRRSYRRSWLVRLVRYILNLEIDGIVAWTLIAVVVLWCYLLPGVIQKLWR